MNSCWHPLCGCSITAKYVFSWSGLSQGSRWERVGTLCQRPMIENASWNLWSQWPATQLKILIWEHATLWMNWTYASVIMYMFRTIRYDNNTAHQVVSLCHFWDMEKQTECQRSRGHNRSKGRNCIVHALQRIHELNHTYIILYVRTELFNIKIRVPFPACTY